MSEDLPVKDDLLTTYQLAPSLLSADFSRLGEDIRQVMDEGVRVIHVDVMDGHFVPNITIGPVVVGGISELVHAEASTHLNMTLSQIRAAGCKAGVSLNPATPIAALQEVIGDIDFALMMTVNPGFSGQEFIDSVLAKIKRARQLLPDGVGLEVDGGIAPDNIDKVLETGANLFVAGSAVFGAPDPAAAARELMAAMEARAAS